MGEAAAISVVRRGGRVLLCSRSTDKLVKAKERVLTKEAGGSVDIAPLDATDEEDLMALAEKLPQNEYDTLIVSAAGKAPHGSLYDLSTNDTREMIESKFFSAYLSAKYISPKLSDGGSITFVSGVLNRRPGINCSPLAVTNGALEGLTRSLALELGPRLRVNCLSPGFCDTARFDHMDKERKAAMLANTADSLPLKRVGTPQDMGEAIYYLSSSPFVTGMSECSLLGTYCILAFNIFIHSPLSFATIGVILDVDGGHTIRQYANKSTDVMRNKK